MLYPLIEIPPRVVEFDRDSYSYVSELHGFHNWLYKYMQNVLKNKPREAYINLCKEYINWFNETDFEPELWEEDNATLLDYVMQHPDKINEGGLVDILNEYSMNH